MAAPGGAPVPPAPPRDPGAGGAVAEVLRGPVGRSAALGLAGACCLTIGGFGAGAKPRTGAFDWTHLTGMTSGVAQALLTWVVWAGVVLMLGAWVRLGREAWAGRLSLTAARSTVVLWVLPMLVALPMFSRDAYSYLAQGALLRDGFDPYAVGPAASDPGPLLDSVSPVWRSQSAPYGPGFLLIARGVATLTGDQVVVGTLVMRLALLPGLVLLVWALPRVARLLGGDPSLALWLGALNPLVLVHLVAGTHNDLPMLGLMLTGLLLVLRRHPLFGIAVIALAVTVKATAAVLLPFVVWIAMAHARERATERGRPPPASVPLFLRTAGGGIAVFAAVFAAVTLAAGVGLGWVGALSGTSSKVITWLSLPTAAAQLVTQMFPLALDPVLTVARAAGAVLCAGVAVLVWIRSRPRGRPAWWSPWPPPRTTSGDVVAAVRGAAVVFAAVALLSPAVLPWYWTWPLVLVAVLPPARTVVVVATALSTWLALVFQPAGDTALYLWPQVIAAVVAAVLAAWLLTREPT